MIATVGGLFQRSFRLAEPALSHQTGNRRSTVVPGRIDDEGVVAPDDRDKIQATRLASASRPPMRRDPAIPLRSR